jgi:DNA-directed RNA polymerase subunit M/transcription elongation factor TFIIS
MSISDYRQETIEAIEHATGLSEAYVKNLEIGIFNWAIDNAEANRVMRTWRDERFINIYKNKARSVLANIDPTSYLNNARLLERLNEEEFKPQDIPYMKPQNIFPEKWNDIIQIQEKREDNLLHKQQVARTDQITCRRCKKKECNYYELQTRSSDEPMTAFVTCLNCGNRWTM